MKRVINTSKAPSAIGPYSQAVEVNGTLYVSGQIPFVPETMTVISDDVKLEGGETPLFHTRNFLSSF